MTDQATTTAVTATPAASSPAKPGYKTTEFWLKLAALLLTALYGSGVIPTAGPVSQVAAIAATLLLSLGYTVSRTLVKTATILLVAGALTSTSSACTASARETTIKTTLATTDAASAAFVAYDKAHQTAIVAAAPDKATGQAQLAVWRTEQVKVAGYIAAVYRAAAAAAIANDQPTLDGLVQAALVLSGALHDLGVIK